MARKKHVTRKLHLLTQEGIPFQFVEAYKALRTNISFITATTQMGSFVVTSALPDEGKSNTVLNLATTLAEGGKRVVVVDCDLRKPVLHRFLGLKRNTLGISNVLAGEAELKECVYSVTNLNFAILPAGTIPPNPTELLGDEKMGKILNFLKTQFDYVIVDAPPMSIVTDAAIIGRYVDGAILVVRANHTPRQTVQFAKKKLEDVNIKIFGAILNRFNAKQAQHYSGYYYSYRYRYYRTHE